jgi:2-methylcitrate dehydratase PrpD
VQAVVLAEMANGSVVEVRCDTPRGSPDNPLTRAQLEAKFRTYAKGRLPSSRIDDVVNAVSNLESLRSARSLMDRLRAR